MQVAGTYESSAESLIEILSYMAPYFPFSSSGSRNIKVRFVDYVNEQVLMSSLF